MFPIEQVLQRSEVQHSFLGSCVLLLTGYFIFLWFILDNKGLSVEKSRRRRAWIFTFMSSVTISLLSLPYVYSLIFESKFDLSQHPVQQYPLLDVALNTFFITYLILDLLIGMIHYPKEIYLLSGWIHHLLYVILNTNLIHHNLTTPFAYFAIMELPTAILSIGHLWKPLRNDWLFGLSFFLTRIAFHLILIYQFLFNFPYKGWWSVVVFIFGFHCYWFRGWIKQQIRLFNERRNKLQ